MYYNIIGDTMNNNGERINKYNEILIKFLNDLVNGINPSNELMVNLINDVTANFSKQLATEELDIADNGVKTLLTNAFNEYIKILKYHFDHSDIHRIDPSHENNEDINAEVNQVTSNLTNAVNNMNKLPEYQKLVNSIRDTLINYFVQTFPNKENVSNISEKIIMDCIVSCFNSLSASKIEEFYTNTLPNLISTGDDIVYVRQITQEEIEAINLQVNDERDAFIYETMDVEIKEGFENGVVTLDVTDAMGKTIRYEGREAMEKLVSYNQLFEASRPGKKADISKWEHLLEKMYEEDAREESNPNPVEVNINNNNDTNNTDNDTSINNNPVDFNINNMDNSNTFDNLVNTQANTSSSMVNVLPTNEEEEDNNENNDINDLLSKMNNTMDESNESNTFNPNSDLITPSNEIDSVNNDMNMNNNSVSNLTESNTPVNNNEQVIKDFLSNHEASVDTAPTIPINISSDGTNTNEVVNNNLASNALNSMINATQQVDNNDIEETADEKEMHEIKSMVGIKEDPKPRNNDMYSSSFSFVPNFDNPNQERDDFIKKATGILIEEDVDNQGDLYLKVTEPTGREQIYTGKEAVNMIKNYNRTYLDANPGKKVDTSLIDKFEE